MYVNKHINILDNYIHVLKRLLKIGSDCVESREAMANCVPSRADCPMFQFRLCASYL